MNQQNTQDVPTTAQKIASDTRKDILRISEAAAGEGAKDQKDIAEIGLRVVATLLRKNRDYGSTVFRPPVLDPSMSTLAAILVRMSDKVGRIAQLVNAEEKAEVAESLSDTMTDLAGYCVLAAVVLDRESSPWCTHGWETLNWHVDPEASGVGVAHTTEGTTAVAVERAEWDRMVSMLDTITDAWENGWKDHDLRKAGRDLVKRWMDERALNRAGTEDVDGGTGDDVHQTEPGGAKGCARPAHSYD